MSERQANQLFFQLHISCSSLLRSGCRPCQVQGQGPCARPRPGLSIWVRQHLLYTGLPHAACQSAASLCPLMTQGELASKLAAPALTSHRAGVGGSQANPPQYGALRMALEIVRREGAHGLYAGLPPALLRHIMYTGEGPEGHWLLAGLSSHTCTAWLQRGSAVPRCSAHGASNVTALPPVVA